jgi:hypothetical protein
LLVRTLAQPLDRVEHGLQVEPNEGRHAWPGRSLLRGMSAANATGFQYLIGNLMKLDVFISARTPVARAFFRHDTIGIHKKQKEFRRNL